GIVLERGRLIHAGDIGDALQCYHDLMARLRRGEEVELDEPAGEESAHVFGAVEVLRADARGRFLLKGWMVDGHGGLPTALVVAWRGQRSAERVRERILRREVMRHFGMADGTGGFLAEVELRGAGAPAELGGIGVLGGHGEEQADSVLGIAA